MIFAIVFVVAGATLKLPQNPTWGQRATNGLVALGLAVVAIMVLTLGYALIVAPYEQRNALRRLSPGENQQQTELAVLFLEGQALRLRTITSDAELHDWSKEVVLWSDRVSGELSHAERAVFMDITALEIRADFPGASSPAHGGGLSTLDRHLTNLMKILDRRVSS